MRSTLPESIRTKKELTRIKTETYQTRPIEIEIVEAVQLTEEDFEAIATWCGGTIVNQADPHSRIRYISINTTNSLTEAYVGDWILVTSQGYKIYGNIPFSKIFERKNITHEE